jgi:bifunctional DNase/RNase
MELQGVSASRPLPYDIMRALITELGGTVERIRITDLSQDVFYARIVISTATGNVEIDSRPSDAIALAVRVTVPILVDESVMDKAGVTLGAEDDEDDELEDDIAGDLSEEREAAPRAADDERLSVFRDFINTLDLDDFDRKKGN